MELLIIAVDDWCWWRKDSSVCDLAGRGVRIFLLRFLFFVFLHVSWCGI